MSTAVEQQSLLVRVKQEKHSAAEERKEAVDDREDEHRDFTVFIENQKVKIDRLEKLAKDSGANLAEIALAKCNCQFAPARCSACANILQQ